LGPTRPTLSPRSMVKLTSRMAVMPPKDLVTPSTDTSDPSGDPPVGVPDSCLRDLSDRFTG
jgi:hypothetical protein